MRATMEYSPWSCLGVGAKYGHFTLHQPGNEGLDEEAPNSNSAGAS
jgi:hypothetical protein